MDQKIRALIFAFVVFLGSAVASSWLGSLWVGVTLPFIGSLGVTPFAYLSPWVLLSGMFGSVFVYWYMTRKKAKG